MTGVRRTREKRAKDRAEIARLALFGNITQQEIAEKVGLNQATISRELKAVRDEWRKSAVQDINDVIARELQKLDALEIEVLTEWERSKRDWQKKVVEDKPRGGGQSGKSARIESGGQCGDPRYIQSLLGIQDRRAKLLGTDKPHKVAPTTPSGDDPYDGMSDAEIAARIIELSAKVGPLGSI
jgi:transcriptional regulator with XRE-family HTH domain